MTSKQVYSTYGIASDRQIETDCHQILPEIMFRNEWTNSKKMNGEGCRYDRGIHLLRCLTLLPPQGPIPFVRRGRTNGRRRIWMEKNASVKTTGKCGPLLLGFSPVRIPDALNHQISQNNKMHMALVIYLCCLLLKLIGAFVTVFVRNFRFITRLSKYLREESCFYRSSAPDFLASILVFFLF